MTAINLFAQPGRAMLITDGAGYNAAGIVLEIASKVIVNASLRIAVAVSGRMDRPQLCDRLASAQSAVDAVGSLPDIARQLRAASAIDQPTLEAQGLNDFQLFAAFWDDRLDRASGVIMSTNQAYFGAGYRPYDLEEVHQLSSPPVGAGVDPARFDPVEDGRSLIEAQRRQRCDDHHWIGGFAELTIVDRAGVRQQRLVTWPDRVGEPILPGKIA